MKKLRHSILPITLESTDELKSDLLNAIDVQMTNSGWAKWVDEYGNWFDPFYKNSNQLELFDKDDKQIMDEVTEYFEYLQTPNDAFSGMAVWPFLKAERATNKLFVKIWRPDEIGFKDMFDEFNNSEFESAIFICMNSDGIDWKHIERKKYQNSLQDYLKHTKYKPLCFSPFEEWSAGGEETRKKSPYFLINVAERKVLDDAHSSLIGTKYFDKFNDKEIKKLKVYPKKKK